MSLSYCITWGYLYKNYIVYKHVTFLFHGRYGYLTVRRVSFLNSIRLLRYVSRNWRRRRRRRTTTTTKWRIVKMDFYTLYITTFPLSDFGWGPPYFDAYCHGNADFPERCWPTTTIPIYKDESAILMVTWRSCSNGYIESSLTPAA